MHDTTAPYVEVSIKCSFCGRSLRTLAWNDGTPQGMRERNLAEYVGWARTDICPPCMIPGEDEHIH